jgi:hypothetical protein
MTPFLLERAPRKMSKSAGGVTPLRCPRPHRRIGTSGNVSASWISIVQRKSPGRVSPS